MSWQDHRRMSGAEYQRVVRKLKLSRAAAGRYLGVSARTSRRYCRDEAKIPPAQVLLLRALLVYGVAPLVPKWSDEQN
jgi:DNA-binding transcriptional regulator YiaG